MAKTLPRYVLVTPARNEVTFIRKTLESVVAQTHRPVKWVIVSDGSTDGTDDAVRPFAETHDWIELVSLPARAQRNFAGKVAAFNAGYARLEGVQYDVIGNLDADVSFDPDYLAFLMGKFAENDRLGIGGTPYAEENAIHDHRFRSPDHVSGACQMFKRECFEEIGGYPQVRTGGIDLIVVLAAQAKGWQTRRFDERFCVHHRNVGSELHSDVYRRLLNLGRKDYLLGSHPAFEVFRSIFQMKTRPYVIGGVLMLWGYSWALIRNLERSMPDELIRIRRDDQMRRLKAVLRHPLKRSGAGHPATARP